MWVLSATEIFIKEQLKKKISFVVLQNLPVLNGFFNLFILCSSYCSCELLLFFNKQKYLLASN